MALGSQLPIRLDKDVEKRLNEAAIRAGTSKSALVRLLTTTFVDQVVRPDGTIMLPPNWSELLPARDARAAKKKSLVAINADFVSSLNEEPTPYPNIEKK